MLYLLGLNKNIHVVDVQDTLGVGEDNEIVFNFEMRNSPYSINPFEFLLDEKSGGPKAQTADIMSMFQKTYMKRLNSSPNQSTVLSRLIMDTYRMKGIEDQDSSTWGLDLSKKMFSEHLPVISDMKELVDYILEYVSAGYGAKFSALISSNGKKLNQWHNDVARYTEELKQLGEVADRDEDLAKKEKDRLEAEVATIKANISSNVDMMSNYLKEYLHYQFLDGDIPVYQALMEQSDEGYAWLDYKFYSDKERLKTIRNIDTYLQALNQAAVFGRSTPTPSFTKINRYNLASLNDEARLFCADILSTKIFRLVYLRGEYKELPVGNSVYTTKRAGTTVDTVCVYDEMQTLFPDTAQEAKNKNLLYNRMIGQVRNFGAAMVVLSQTPENFPELFHTNVGTKIILNTAANDIPKVRASAGIKDANLFKHLEHRNKAGNFDVALMKDRVGEWMSVRLPWFDE